MKIDKKNNVIVKALFLSPVIVGFFVLNFGTILFVLESALISKNVFASPPAPILLKLSQQSESYLAASTEKNYISFTLESVKMALFKSDFTGFVKSFEVSSRLNQKKLSNIELEIDATSMDTDSDGRNKKMWEHCLKVAQFKKIRVTSLSSVDLTGETQAVNLEVEILGKRFPLIAQVTPVKTENKIAVDIVANTSLSALMIPPPVNPVASLGDEIRLKAHFETELK